MNSSPETVTAWVPAALEGSPLVESTETWTPEAWAPPVLGPSSAVSAEPRPAGGGLALVTEESGDSQLEAAYRRGLAEGEARGREVSAGELDPSIRALQQVAITLSSSQGRILRDLEANVHGVAIAVARKILDREVTVDEAWVGGLVARAIELIRPERPMEIHLHPLDLEPVRSRLENLEQDGGTPVRWEADPALARGSFHIESPTRLVDGRIEEALRALYERLAYE